MMKSSTRVRLLLCAICLVCCRVPSASAGSATWTSAPGRMSWTDPANWNPMTVPNGPADVATFAASSSTNVSSGAAIQVASVVFSPGASSFQIAQNVGTLTISGAGVVNDSGIAQNFAAAPSQQLGTSPLLSFTNEASAGDAIYSNVGQAFEATTVGATEFRNSATAGSATFMDNAGFMSGGHTTFRDSSSAGQATFFNFPAFLFSGPPSQGFTEFYGSSSAAQASFTCYGATQSGVFGIDYGGAVTFSDSSTAADSVLDLEGGTGSMTAGGQLTFTVNATAANATITAGAGANGGLDASVYFLQGSLGGAARLILCGDARCERP